MSVTDTPEPRRDHPGHRPVARPVAAREPRRDAATEEAATAAAGEDPAAIRLALLSQHYRTAWEWTDAHLEAARQRLDRWRHAAQTATTSPPTADAGDGPAGDAVARQLAERLADDLDTPGALTVVDRWADAVLGEQTGAAAAEARAETRGVRTAVDALLGIDLG